MRDGDKWIFKDAAKEYNVAILVRDTNAASLKYVGMQGFCPKPLDCKAKTADMGTNQGLVVAFDAVHLELTYKPDKILPAKSEWKKFLGSQNARRSSDLNETSRRFSVDLDPKSDRFGCIMAKDKLGSAQYIHGDYDLKDIIPADQPSQNTAIFLRLHGQKHMRDPNFSKVQFFVNQRIGVDMLQHGGEAQYSKHVDDVIHVFVPDGRSGVLQSLQEIENLYKAMDRMTGTPAKYGAKKIDVLHSPSSAPGFEDFAIRWFERKFGK
jgi:hypothetical protein